MGTFDASGAFMCIKVRGGGFCTACVCVSVFKPVQEKKFFSLGKKEGVMFPKAKQLSSKALVDLVTTRTRDSLRAWKLSGGYWAPGGCMPGPEKGCGRARGLVTIRRESQRKGGDRKSTRLNSSH